MKLTSLLLLLCSCFALKAQYTQQAQNIFIITTDGLRWQEVFNGADTSILNNNNYVEDPALLKQLYDDSTVALRRQKLMPFFWNTIAKKGQLYGNRNYDNKVDVSNIYKFSYPGYNEIFTGYADKRFIPNTPRNNRNINILEYLNNQEEYKGKVVAFSSWNIFPYILNEERSHVPVNSGYENIAEENSSDKAINDVQDSIENKTSTRHDLLTYMAAKEYVQTHHPRVMILGLGETDKFAHNRRYDLYLQQANNVDKMIAELWYYVQTDPFYKSNTTFIITTDHGRGRKTSSWHSHHLFIKGSGEIWLAMLGAGIEPTGEAKNNNRFYQKQVAATVAMLLGQKFETNHPVGAPLVLPASNSIDHTANNTAAFK